MAFSRESKPRTPEALIREGDKLRLGADGKQSFEEAFYCYKKAAAKGDPHAMYLLGTMYEAGHGTNQSYKDAYKWYDRSALKEDRDGRAALGFLYEAGLGTKRSRPLAIENHEGAAHAGSQRAMNNLGLIYLDRGGREFSDHAAVTFFQKGNLEKYPPSIANLARMYETGKGLTRNCSTAANLFRNAAKAGNLPAKVYLAEMMKYGIGIETRQDAAHHLFLEAARWGDPIAIAEINGEDVEMDVFVAHPEADSNPKVQLNYGLMFLFGCRAPVAPATAFHFLESSAKAGNTDAMYVLGQAYELGIGTEKSMFLAKKWYSWGAEKGNGPCAFSLGCIAEDAPNGGDVQSAIGWYRRSLECEQDADARSDALMSLGYLLARGADPESSPEEALALLKEAADLGHSEAQYFAGKLMLEKGDRSGASKYLGMAAEQGDDRAKEIIEAEGL